MRLRTKSLLILGGTVVFFASVIYVAALYILQSRFTEIEITDVRRDIDRTVLSIDAEIDRLDETTQDYSKWDDSYNYLETRDPVFIQNNIAPTLLALDLVLYMKNDGDVVYVSTNNPALKRNIPVTDDFVKQLTAANSPFHFTDINSKRKGFVMSNGVPMLIAAEPITSSDRKSPVHGTLFMGRLLDEAYVKKISDRTRLKISAIPLDSIKDRSAFPTSWFHGVVPSQHSFVKPQTEDSVFGYALISDVFAHPAFVLCLDLPRVVYSQGQVASSSLLYAVSGLGLLLMIVVLLMTERFVLSRISKLSGSISRVRQSGKPSDFNRLEGSDELAEFSQTLDEAFVQIQRFEDRLRGEREKLDTILQSIGEGVFVVGLDRKILLANRMTEKLTGYSAAELMGAPYRDRLVFRCERDTPDCEDFIETVLQEKKMASTSTPMIIINKDGGSIPIANASAPIFDAAGKILGCVVVFRDVTREREVDRLRSELVSIASHQLRTPLSGIKWALELLLGGTSGKLAPEQRTHLAQIAESNQRMIALVEDLLNVSHIESGRKFVITMKRADLMDVVRDVLKEQAGSAAERKVKLTLSKTAPRSCQIRMDADKIREVVQNLVGNAVKYSFPGGHVTVDVKCTNDAAAAFHVKDSGIGIPLEQQGRVFERFFRAENAQTGDVSGTGLGLYIAKSIVEGHRGKIWFTSAEGKGSEFSFSIPSAEPEPKRVKKKAEKA